MTPMMRHTDGSFFFIQSTLDVDVFHPKRKRSEMRCAASEYFRLDFFSFGVHAQTDIRFVAIFAIIERTTHRNEKKGVEYFMTSLYFGILRATRCACACIVFVYTIRQLTVHFHSFHSSFYVE